MSFLKLFLRRFYSDIKGAALMEYALLGAILLMLPMLGFSNILGNLFVQPNHHDSCLIYKTCDKAVEISEVAPLAIPSQDPAAPVIEDNPAPPTEITVSKPNCDSGKDCNITIPPGHKAIFTVEEYDAGYVNFGEIETHEGNILLKGEHGQTGIMVEYTNDTGSVATVTYRGKTTSTFHDNYDPSKEYATKDMALIVTEDQSGTKFNLQGEDVPEDERYHDFKDFNVSVEIVPIFNLQGEDVPEDERNYDFKDFNLSVEDIVPVFLFL